MFTPLQVPLPPSGTLASSQQSSAHDVPEQPKKGRWIKPSIAMNRVMRYLVLCTTSLHLVAENLRAQLLGLGLVDVLHQHALVFEDVTL